MFNALKYTKNLEENGFEREQAEVLVGLFMQMLEFNMVSKSDFEKFQSVVYRSFEKINERFERVDEKFEKIDLRFDRIEDKFNEDMENLESRLNLKIDNSESRLNLQIDNLESRLNLKIDNSMNKLTLQLTVKLGIMLAVSVGLISTILAIKL